jgi:hypothetical protein
VAAGRVGLRVRWLKGDKGGPEMAEVLGSLVLGEQKTKDPGGDGGFVSKQNESPGGGLRLLLLQEGEQRRLP